MPIKAVSNGKTFTFPDGTSQEDAADAIDGYFAKNPVQNAANDTPSTQPTEEPKSYLSRVGENLGNEVAGLVRGAGTIGNFLIAGPKSAMTPYGIPGNAASPTKAIEDQTIGAPQGEKTIADLVRGTTPDTPFQARQKGLDQALTTMGANPDSGFYKGGKVAAEIAGTAGLPVATARGLKAVAPAAEPLAAMIESGGLGSLGERAPGVAAALKNLALRVGGGAIGSAETAGVVDPENAKLAAGIGAALPVGVRAAAAPAANVAVRALAPFLESGQKYTIGDMLNYFASNPERAQAALKAAGDAAGSGPVAYPSGALANVAEVAGDTGLVGLNRALASTSKDYPAMAAERANQQLESRSSMMEDIASSPGKKAVAENERDAATAEMRNAALEKAGNVPYSSISGRIESLLKDPDNAGKLSQQAIGGIKSQLEKFVGDDGKISARAVYAIRKDINTILEGKMQGDESNLKYASSQLIKVKNIFDDVLDKIPKTETGTDVAIIPKTGKAVNPINIQSRPIDEVKPEEVSTGFKKYLKTYSDMSKPIDQMDEVEKVFKAAQTGTELRNGRLVLSAPKLNNYLKTNGAELEKVLTPDQMRIVRNLQEELNSSNTALNEGKAIGSNTVQNYSMMRAMDDVMGAIGMEATGKSAIGKLLGKLQSGGNEAIMEQLGHVMQDPKQAHELMRLASQKNAGAQDLIKFIGSTSTKTIGELTKPGGK